MAMLDPEMLREKVAAEYAAKDAERLSVVYTQAVAAAMITVSAHMQFISSEGTGVLILGICALLAPLVVAYRVAQVLKPSTSMRVLVSALYVVPIVCILAQLLLIKRVRVVLKLSGYKVGFFRATKRAVV
jgi:hypothetical protein